MILIGVILSAIWAGTALMFKYSDIDVDLGKFYERLSGMSPANLRKKVRRHLLEHPRLQAVKALNLPLGVLFAAGSSAVFTYSAGEVLIGHAISMSASILLMLSSGPKMMRWRIQLFAQVAAQMAARKFPPAEAVPLLIDASRRPHPYQRIAAAYGLASFPRGQAYLRLAELTQDKDRSVSQAALQRFNELGRWLAIIEERKAFIPDEIRDRAGEIFSPLSPTPMPGIRSRAMQQEEEKRMMPVLIEQADLKWHYPYIFCKKCLARSTVHGTGEWIWVTCRLCGEAEHLVPQVKIVIGVLDGAFSWDLNATWELRLGLWEESSKSVRLADIDYLEVSPAPGVDTNWALAATMTALEARPPGWEVLVTDASILSENSRRMLEAHKKK